MNLTYDFDIRWSVPREIFSDPRLGAEFADAGIPSGARGHYVALFRDPATAAALRGASESVRHFFENSGFGFDTFDSGASAGRYPAEDEPAHVDVIERLSENLAEFSPADRAMNGFDFGAFLDHVMSAEPEHEASREPAAAPSPVPRRLPGRALVGAAAAVLIGVGLWYGAARLGLVGLFSGQFDAGLLHAFAGGGE